MSRSCFAVFLAAAIIIPSLSSCNLMNRSADHGNSGAVIATVGKTKVYANEFIAYLLTMPSQSRQEANKPEQRLQFLKGYLYLRSISELARQAEIDKDPEYLQSVAAYQVSQLNRLYTQSLPKHQVSEAEAREYYNAHSSEYIQRTYHASHIVTLTQGDAEKALKLLRAGKPFAEVAKRMSIDKRTARRGGKMAPFTREPQNFPQTHTLQNLKKGQLSQIIRTSAGYEILRLDRELTGTPKPFESVVNDIQTQLSNRKASEQLSANLKQINTQILENEVKALQIPEN